MPRTPPPLSPAYALAWSYTRHTLLSECHRAVFWTYFGCRGQGLPPGDRSAPLAAALKHLTTVPLLIGTVVHNAARRVVDAVIAGGKPPTLDDLHTGARFALNAAWRGSQPDQVDRFWENPAIYTALQEIVDRGHLSPDEVLRARTRLYRCLEALMGAPVLADIGRCAAGECWVPPAGGPTSFAPEAGQHVWGAVDVAYRHGDMAAVEAALEGSGAQAPGDATWCVADWKTGARVSPEQELRQLGVYALWLESAGYPSTDGAYLGRIVDLTNREDRWYLLDEDLRDRTRAVIAADTERLRALMADPVRALPQPKSHWALAASPRRCPACRFHRLCRDELPVPPDRLSS